MRSIFIVVYKVDRLTRSLTDFAKLVGIWMNTTSRSYPCPATEYNRQHGRLTLHMLLSFASSSARSPVKGFETNSLNPKRKASGWAVRFRWVTRSKTESWWFILVKKAMVQLIFKTFIETKSLSETSYRINVMGLRTKRYLRKDGSVWGGRRFIRNTVLKLLKNQGLPGD